jgi:hypothetical protein
MSVFTEYETQPQVIDTNIKEFVIERLKEGKAPTQIKEEVQKMYSKTISKMAVYRIRNQYTKATGEYILRQTKFYKNK